MEPINKDSELTKIFVGYWLTDTLIPGEEGFPNLSQSIRGKPAEEIVKYWYTGLQQIQSMDKEEGRFFNFKSQLYYGSKTQLLY